jgi:hypothetical protein
MSTYFAPPLDADWLQNLVFENMTSRDTTPVLLKVVQGY